MRSVVACVHFYPSHKIKRRVCYCSKKWIRFDYKRRPYNKSERRKEWGSLKIYKFEIRVALCLLPQSNTCESVLTWLAFCCLSVLKICCSMVANKKSCIQSYTRKLNKSEKNEGEDEETQAHRHHLSMIFEFYRLLEAASSCHVQPKGNSDFMQTHKAWEKAFSPPAHSAECIKSGPVCSCRSTSPILHLLFIFLKYRNCIDACIHVHRLVATVIAVNIVIIVVVVVQNNFTGHAQPT